MSLLVPWTERKRNAERSPNSWKRCSAADMAHMAPNTFVVVVAEAPGAVARFAACSLRRRQDAQGREAVVAAAER